MCEGGKEGGHLGRPGATQDAALCRLHSLAHLPRLWATACTVPLTLYNPPNPQEEVPADVEEVVEEEELAAEPAAAEEGGAAAAAPAAHTRSKEGKGAGPSAAKKMATSAAENMLQPPTIADILLVRGWLAGGAALGRVRVFLGWGSCVPGGSGCQLAVLQYHAARVQTQPLLTGITLWRHHRPTTATPWHC